MVLDEIGVCSWRVFGVEVDRALVTNQRMDGWRRGVVGEV